MIMRPVQDLVAIERGVRAELRCRVRPAAAGVWKLRATPRSFRRNLRPLWHEDLRAKAVVERLESLDRHAAGEAGGDDRAGRRAADEIEIVAEQRSCRSEPRSEQGLDGLEKFERENAPDAAAVERKNALWAGAGSRCWALVSGNGVSHAIFFHRVSQRRTICVQKNAEMSGANCAPSSPNARWQARGSSRIAALVNPASQRRARNCAQATNEPAARRSDKAPPRRRQRFAVDDRLLHQPGPGGARILALLHDAKPSRDLGIGLDHAAQDPCGSGPCPSCRWS